MKFEERIQLLRKDKGLSQEELAELLGISRQAVAKWESGLSYPDVINLIALSKIFHVSIDHLLKDEEDNCSSSGNNFTKVDKTITEDLIDFLCRAKRNTYAGNGGEITSSRANSHDLSYKEGEFSYLDTYLGGENFIGEEAVWKNNNPIWSMNYCGKVLGEGFSGEFLKEVLYQVPKNMPFRGPMIYHDGDYTYHCAVNGSVEWFQGYEDIFLFGEKVYECYFHGGIVK